MFHTFYSLTIWELLGVHSKVFASRGEANDSPPLRNKHLKKEKVIPGKPLHADKGFFGKDNIKKCKELGLKPNIVPKDPENLSDNYLKKYVKREYDNEARKKTRGLVETPYGGMETENYMKLRSRKPHTRDIYVCMVGLKHELRTYMRASLMKLFYSFRTNLTRPKTFLN